MNYKKKIKQLLTQLMFSIKNLIFNSQIEPDFSNKLEKLYFHYNQMVKTNISNIFFENFYNLFEEIGLKIDLLNNNSLNTISKILINILIISPNYLNEKKWNSIFKKLLNNKNMICNFFLILEQINPQNILKLDFFWLMFENISINFYDLKLNYFELFIKFSIFFENNENLYHLMIFESLNINFINENNIINLYPLYNNCKITKNSKKFIEFIFETFKNQLNNGINILFNFLTKNLIKFLKFEKF